MTNSLLGLAVVLFVLWLVLRIAFAITGFFLHLLWLGAILMLVIWLIRKITSK